MSVLDNPVDKLYAGALLGAALSKQVGEVGAQGAGREESERRATLEAGVASGKINPNSLSKGDAGLLGVALEASKVKIPSVVSDPLGFVGGFASNLGKGAAEFAESYKGIPQAALSIGQAGVTSVEKAGGDPYRMLFEAGQGANPLGKEVGGIVQNTLHDFSSPRQIYEHPFEPLMDVAGLASGGAGAAIKGAGALSRAGLLDPGALEAPTLAGKVIKLGSTLGRPDAIASPGFTAENADRLAEAGVQGAKIGRPYSPNLGMKYLGQKIPDWIINQARDVKVPGSSGTLGDLQGQYYGKKLINATRAQISAGTAAEFANSPVQDFIDSAGRMYAGGQAAGQYQFEATMLHSMGIDNLDKLDQYVESIRNGEDVDGLAISPEMQKAAQYRSEKLYQDPRFRQLIEEPTDKMKDLAYNLRRVNVDQASKLAIDPTTSEDSALGRLKVMLNKTNEETRAELPAELRPTNVFAKGLQLIQEDMLGKPIPDRVPSLNELAMELPYGGVGLGQKAKLALRVPILQRAVESLRRDIADTEPLFDRLQDPNYVAGNNLFDKIATALHDELGVDPEQAQSFARGVALGSVDGPILPTYVPSVSGEKLNFGIRPDPLKTKVGRVLGVSKFRSLEDIEKQPTYYDFKRPFNPRTASAQTIGLGPSMNYMNDATYGRFIQGTMRLDPEAIIKNAYQIQRDLVSKRLNDGMIQKLAIKGPDGAIRMYRGSEEMDVDLGNQAAFYQFVPVDTWRNFFKSETELQAEVGGLIKDVGDKGHISDGVANQELMQEIEGLADESAHRFVHEELAKASAGHVEGVALPTTYVKTIVAHARLSEEGTAFGRTLSFLTGRWKSAVLTIMPTWLERTTIGHGIIALIDGTVNPKFWAMAHDYFSDRPVLPEQVKSIAWGKKYGDSILNPQPIPYGVNQGGMATSEATGRMLGQGRVLGKTDISQSLPGRLITKEVHTSTNYQRRAIFLRNLDRGAKQRLAELGKDLEHPGGFWNAKNIDAVLDPAWRAEVLKYPDLVEHAMDQLHHASYTFGQMSPWERKVVKFGMPFYGWKKFINKFVWSMPLNYPGRAAAIAALGRVGVEEHSALGAIPDYLMGAVFYDTNDLSRARYLNLYGLNPLGDIADPFGKEGPLEGTINLSELSPVVQAVAAGLGINPISDNAEEISPTSGIETNRYGEYINTKTGEKIENVGTVNPLQRIVGTFLRAFPEMRSAELLKTGGNPVYPESIPFIDEKPIGVQPYSRKTFTVPRLLEQEVGVQPATYNIAKHTADLLKEVAEAHKKNEKTIRKMETKLAAPPEE